MHNLRDNLWFPLILYILQALVQIPLTLFTNHLSGQSGG